jgi:hypothetical protein
MKGPRRVPIGTKVRSDVLSRDPDTLFPLQGALGYEITQSLFVGKHVLLVEGASDILYLQAFSQALTSRKRNGLDPRWTICPSGGIGSTVRNGKRALLKLLLDKPPYLDKIAVGRKADPAEVEANATVWDILRSPVLKRILCIPTNFSFNPRSVIQARVNRAELGEFDALVLGLFLMLRFKGQVVVPDFGFYGREAHASLIREERLIAGVNFLGELSPKLRRSVLLMEGKVAAGTTVEDAETLAAYERLVHGTNGFNEFVESAIA